MTEPAPFKAVATDWAGLTQQGRVLVSIDRVTHGQPLPEIVDHERGHAVLIRNTVLGWVLNTLATFGLPPWPEVHTRERCYALLNVLADATRWTHEGLATFLAGLNVEEDSYAGYRDRQPSMYLRAASELDWLRRPGLDVEARADIGVMLACLASGTPVLESWGRDQLTEVSRAEAWFSEPVNRPDARFPAVCRAMSGLGNAELVHLAADPEVAQSAAAQLVRMGGAAPEFVLLREDARLDDAMGIARAVIAPLLDDPTLPALERGRLREVIRVPEMAVRGLAPSNMAILVTRTRGGVGRYVRDPDPRDLVGYDLVTIHYNSSFNIEPGLTPSGADPIPLLPREAVCYCSGRGLPQLAAIFSASAFLDWLDVLDDSVTLAVLDSAYLALGMRADYLPAALVEHRHVVLVAGRTPYDVVLDAASSYDSSATVFITVNASDVVGVSYVMLRQDGALSPVILVPTFFRTARETVDRLTGHQDGPQFRLVGPQDFFLTREGLVDVMRVISDFETDDPDWLEEVSRAGRPDSPPPRGTS